MSKGDDRRPTFAQHVQDCATVGHAMADKFGNCWRCGATIEVRVHGLQTWATPSVTRVEIDQYAKPG